MNASPVLKRMAQAKPGTNVIVQLFYDVDFRLGLDGLHLMLKKHAIDSTKLNPGELVVFLNTKKNRLRVLGGMNDGSLGVLALYRSPRGRIETRAIQHVAHAFSGGRLNYNEALKAALMQMLPEKKKR